MWNDNGGILSGAEIPYEIDLNISPVSAGIVRVDPCIEPWTDFFFLQDSNSVRKSIAELDMNSVFVLCTCCIAALYKKEEFDIFNELCPI